MVLMALIGTIHAVTCPVDTTIEEPESYIVNNWNVTSTSSELRAAKVAASGAIYFMGYISDNTACTTFKMNADGSSGWAMSHITFNCAQKSLVVDNQENYLYKIDESSPTDKVKIMKQSASTVQMIKYYQW